MLELWSEPVTVALFGAIGGLLLGLAARLGRFCTLGAIEDFFFGNSSARLRMWGIALGIAIVGSFASFGLGWAAIDQSFYLVTPPTLLASVVGGLTFGYGMAMAGNCGFGALARLGGGDLRSFVIVLVMGLSAFIFLSGPLALLRITVFPIQVDDASATGLAHILSGLLGIGAPLVGIAVGAIIFTISALHSDVTGKTIIWGVVVGLAITSGWVGTSYVSQYGFDDLRIVSHTFAAPVGETLLYLMTASGNTLSFGIGSVAGVLVGAFIGSLFKGHFRWEACEDPRELRRQILGAVLMGGGAVIAGGCSIGQGISAFSVLALTAPITLACIVIGAYIGLHRLIVGVEV